MLDFDSQRTSRPETDLKVKAAGVEFRIKPYVGLHVVARFMDSPEQMSHVCENCKHVNTIGTPRPQLDSLDAFEAFLRSIVHEDDLPKVDQLLADDNPESLLPREVQRLGWEIIGLISARPTEQQSGSRNTPETAGTTSTETSHSTEEAG